MMASSWLIMTAAVSFSYASPLDHMHPLRYIPLGYCLFGWCMSLLHRALRSLLESLCFYLCLNRTLTFHVFFPFLSFLFSTSTDLFARCSTLPSLSRP